MNKLNNKGFAVSTILYGILALVILILMLIFGVMKANKDMNKDLSQSIEEQINKCTLLEVQLENCYFSGESCTEEKYEYDICTDNITTLHDQILNDNNAYPDNVSSTYVESETGIKFSEPSSNTNGKGLYYTSNKTENNNVTYYFRGDVENNYISFAGILWRIVRINEDGSVRLITDQSVGQSAFNVNNGDNTYVGYMTGQVGATSYADAHSNTNNSTIKTFVDSWYEANLVQYTSMMSTEAGFCNDRATTGLGYGNNSTSYAAAGRNSRAFIPIFNCSQTNDLFTYSSTKGNNKLDYPVGLLTMDEAIYGGNYINDKDGDYITGGYLASNDAWWTMTPHSYGSGIYYMKSGQDIYTLAYTSNMTSVLGVRPVINLKSTVEISSGNGTSANPYIIKTS